MTYMGRPFGYLYRFIENAVDATVAHHRATRDANVKTEKAKEQLKRKKQHKFFKGNSRSTMGHLSS